VLDIGLVLGGMSGLCLFIVMNEVDQLEAVTICKCGHVDECE
jgi:hypothetical protein